MNQFVKISDMIQIHSTEYCGIKTWH